MLFWMIHRFDSCVPNYNTSVGDNMEEYEPELGQMIQGQPYHASKCPEYVVALLQYIEYEMELTYEDLDGNSPFRNTGNTFENKTFQVEAYSWDENIPQLWNFKYLDVEISWYKHLGRGTTINREVYPEEMIDMFNRCLDSIRFDDEN